MGDRTPYVIPQTVNATDGDVLTFSAATGTWVGAAGSGGGTATGLTFAADNATPTISQTQSTSGAGATFYIRSQQAATGSVLSGGDMSFILGADDGSPGNPRLIWFGLETAAGGFEPSTNYLGMAILKWLPGQVANLVLGPGNNGIGGGCAGCEISAFTELNIATENSMPVNIQIAGTGTTTCGFNILNHDTTDEAAVAIVCTANHATSGDAAALQINYTKTAIGTGVERYVDIQNAGVRRFSIKPSSTSTLLNAETGQILLDSTVAVSVRAPAFQSLNAGVYGLKMDMSTANLVYDTGVSTTVVTFKINTVASFALEANKNICLGAGAGSYGSGQGVIFIANDAADPSGNPTGGGILYVASGALKYKGSSGTVTTLGAA